MIQESISSEVLSFKAHLLFNGKLDYEAKISTTSSSDFTESKKWILEKSRSKLSNFS